jgi:hypothetical protein
VTVFCVLSILYKWSAFQSQFDQRCIVGPHRGHIFHGSVSKSQSDKTVHESLLSFRSRSQARHFRNSCRCANAHNFENLCKTYFYVTICYFGNKLNYLWPVLYA